MPSPAEQMFEAAAELGRLISEQHAIKRRESKEARNARRRARYAATKHLRPAKAAEPAAPEDSDDDEQECRCHVVPMPPCSYCANLTEEEWEALHNAP